VSVYSKGTSSGGDVSVYAVREVRCGTLLVPFKFMKFKLHGNKRVQGVSEAVKARKSRSRGQMHQRLRAQMQVKGQGTRRSSKLWYRRTPNSTKRSVGNEG